MLKLRDVQEYVSDHILWVWISLGLSVATLLWMMWPRHKPQSSMRELTMTVEGRRLYVQRVVLECICDALLEANISGQIENDEANAEMARLAKFYHHEELIPLINDKKKRLQKKQLKNNERRRKLNGRPEHIPIPGPLPGQAETPIVESNSSADTILSILNS